MFVANLVAIPYVSVLIVPWCLFATLCQPLFPAIASGLWWFGAKLLLPLWWWLRVLAEVPGGVWYHAISASQACWLTLATLWWFAPAGWLMRGCAPLLLLPVIWPRDLETASPLLYLPQRSTQLVVILRQGQNLYPIVKAPRSRTRQQLAHWCQNGFTCPTTLPVALRATRQHLGPFQLQWQGDWWLIAHAKAQVIILPEATPARIARLIQRHPVAPNLIIFSTKRSLCWAVAHRLHVAYANSLLLSKNCPGGGWLPPVTGLSGLQALPPGFYSTARNGSITIPLS